MGFLDQYCMGYSHYFVSQVIDGSLRRICMSKSHHFVGQNIDGFPTSIFYGLTIIFGKKVIGWHPPSMFYGLSSTCCKSNNCWAFYTNNMRVAHIIYCRPTSSLHTNYINGLSVIGDCLKYTY